MPYPVARQRDSRPSPPIAAGSPDATGSATLVTLPAAAVVVPGLLHWESASLGSGPVERAPYVGREAAPTNAG
jgi:hypothetical protein